MDVMLFYKEWQYHYSYGAENQKSEDLKTLYRIMKQKSFLPASHVLFIGCQQASFNSWSSVLGVFKVSMRKGRHH